MIQEGRGGCVDIILFNILFTRSVMFIGSSSGRVEVLVGLL
jgi:hypothetical protein